MPISRSLQRNRTPTYVPSLSPSPRSTETSPRTPRLSQEYIMQSNLYKLNDQYVTSADVDRIHLALEILYPDIKSTYPHKLSRSTTHTPDQHIVFTKAIHPNDIILLNNNTATYATSFEQYQRRQKIGCSFAKAKELDLSNFLRRIEKYAYITFDNQTGKIQLYENRQSIPTSNSTVDRELHKYIAPGTSLQYNHKLSKNKLYLINSSTILPIFSFDIIGVIQADNEQHRELYNYWASFIDIYANKLEEKGFKYT